MWEKLLNQKGKKVKNKWINDNNNDKNNNKNDDNNNKDDDNNNENEIKRKDKRKRD